MKKIKLRRIFALLVFSIAIALATCSCSAQQKNIENKSNEKFEIKTFKEPSYYDLIKKKLQILYEFDISIYQHLKKEIISEVGGSGENISKILKELEVANEKIKVLENRLNNLELPDVNNFITKDVFIDSITKQSMINKYQGETIMELWQFKSYIRKKDSIQSFINRNYISRQQNQYNVLHVAVDSLYSIAVPVDFYYTKKEIDSILKL